MEFVLATRKKIEPVYDFDSWDEEAENAAIAALAPDVKHILVEGDFIGRYPDGDTIKLSLSLSLSTVLDLESSESSEVDQFKDLLSVIGDQKDVDTFMDHGITESMALATRYFTILERVAGASLGK